MRFFELGRVFLKLPNGTTREEDRIAMLLSGPVSPTSWSDGDPRIADIFDLRGAIESLSGLGGIEIKRGTDNGTFLLNSEIRSGNRVLGWIAQLHPARARQVDARHPVYVAELLLSAVRQGSSGPAKFEELPKFPAITRDVAMEAPADLANQKVAAYFSGLKEPLLIKAEVFDVFADPTGEKMANDRKSLAYSLTYRSAAARMERALLYSCPATASCLPLSIPLGLFRQGNHDFQRWSNRLGIIPVDLDSPSPCRILQSSGNLLLKAILLCEYGVELVVGHDRPYACLAKLPQSIAAMTNALAKQQ